MEKDLLVSTAYVDGKKYDCERFSDRRGLMFDGLERGQLAAVLEMLPAAGRALEIGCGTGRFLPMVQAAGHNIVGVDPSAPMLKVAESRIAGLEGVALQQAEGAKLPFDDQSFDFVYSIRTLNQVESKDYALRMLNEAFRVVRPGGVLMVEFMNRWGLSPRGVMLSYLDIKRLLAQYPQSHLIRFRGILIFSFTVLRFVRYLSNNDLSSLSLE